MAARIDPAAWGQFLVQVESTIPDEYKQRVRKLVHDADLGARRLAGLKIRRRMNVCKGCGGPFDVLNPYCYNCKCRHSMRRLAKERSANTNGA